MVPSSYQSQHRREPCYIRLKISNRQLTLKMTSAQDVETSVNPSQASFTLTIKFHRGTQKHGKHTVMTTKFFSQLTEIFLVNEHWLLSRSTRNLELTFHTRSEMEKEPFNAMGMQPELESHWEPVKRQWLAIMFIKKKRFFKTLSYKKLRENDS